MTPALADPALLRDKAYVGGRWIGADSGARFPVVNPANGETLAEVADLGAAETARAVEAAQAALPAWRAQTAKARAAILRRWFDLVMAAQDDLATLMTLEQGKPLTESRGEVAYGASFIEWCAEEGKRVYGDIVPAPRADQRILVLRQPIGVVAAITPWNFPIAMITRKVAPALAVGCAAVVKPAEDTPLCALALAVLAEQAGLPPGLVNVVTSSEAAAVGAELTANPIVRKLSFTGSTQVGHLLMRQCAGTVKKVSLELGGDAPFLVFDDADLDAAAEGALAAKFRNSGQTCVCVNRFLVQDDVHDAFVEKLKARMATLTLGDGLEPGVTQGPLINEAALEKVERLVADALAKGARLIAGGRRAALGRTFYEPTLLTGAQPDMALAHEEIFGPVAATFRFRDEAEAIALANATQFGLSAYFYTRDVARAWRVAEALEAGMIGINEGLISNEVAPFGGVKQSGLGREGGRYGVEEYLETKYLCFGGIG
ncbi:NAD-dependent succinate-semialdehyde dehydrogenase [Methylocella sp.]|uniref:NAD-dependent succinate-semialdehyde dehydrogenase n=1 Tax=Methylocella sp. TaxID=1978226 RepID=UPI0035B16719